MLRSFLPVFSFIFLCSAVAHAQQISPDSAYTDKFIALNITDTVNLKGAPDGFVTTFNPTSEAFIYFRPGPETSKTFMIKPEGKLVIYGRRDQGIPFDSSGIFVTFIRESPFVQSRTIRVTGDTNVIEVPDSLFSYVTLSMVYQPTMGDIQSFKRYYVDAILLVQPFDQLSVKPSNEGRIASIYPNPFSVSRGAKMNFSTDKFADISIVLMDLAGREVTRLDMGARPSGDQHAELNVPNEGVFIAQLFLDGVPAGKPYMLTARY
jgi:hypothetical protein